MNKYDYMKEQIKQRVNITDALERYTKRRLDKGKCLCPLHNEKTPSFFINESKGVFYCQGCATGGDVITLVMKYLNINFVEAINILDRDYCLGLNGERISVEAQNKLRLARKQRALEEQRIARKKALYDNLCEKYIAINYIIKNLEPMTDIWGRMLTKRAWIEYELDKLMEGIK